METSPRREIQRVRIQPRLGRKKTRKIARQKDQRKETAPRRRIQKARITPRLRVQRRETAPRQKIRRKTPPSSLFGEKIRDFRTEKKASMDKVDKNSTICYFHGVTRIFRWGSEEIRSHKKPCFHTYY